MVYEPTTYTVPVARDKAGTRLDRLLSDALPAISRSRLQALIGQGCVTREGDAAEVVSDPSRRVRAGERFVVQVPPPRPARVEPQAIPLEVVYEDEHLIVVDKPVGLVVHPAAGHADGTLVNALLAHCGGSLSGIGGETRPGIVHRLDKETSGLLVAAKTDAAHRHLARQFEAHSLERAYSALVWGVPAPRVGEIAGNIGRSPANRKKMAVLKRGGKPALTRYKVSRAVGSRCSRLECRLLTGRTHQIRVHLASRGHPVVGDPLYGGGVRHRLKGAPEAARSAVAALGHQALHAYLMGFSHPETGLWMRFESSLPSYFNKLEMTLDCV